MRMLSMAVLLAPAFLCTPRAQALVLKIATLVPEGTALSEALKAADTELAARTGGAVKLKVYPGGVMGNDEVVLRKMRAGQLHCSSFTSSGLARVYPDFQIMALPMLLTSPAEVDAVRAVLDQQIITNLAARGFVSFGLVENGFVYLMSTHPITGLGDLRGRKIWIPEGDVVSEVVFKEAGVPAVALPIPDVLTGLQTGLLDTVGASPIAALVLQWFTRVKHLSATPLLYSYGAMACSQEAWARLNEAERPIVHEVLSRVLTPIGPRNRADNEAALATLRKQGLVFHPVPRQVQDEWRALGDRAIEILIGRYGYDRGLLAQIRALAAEARAAPAAQP